MWLDRPTISAGCKHGRGSLGDVAADGLLRPFTGRTDARCQRKMEEDILTTLKILIIGESGVGKSR